MTMPLALAKSLRHRSRALLRAGVRFITLLLTGGAGTHEYLTWLWEWKQRVALARTRLTGGQRKLTRCTCRAAGVVSITSPHLRYMMRRADRSVCTRRLANMHRDEGTNQTGRGPLWANAQAMPPAEAVVMPDDAGSAAITARALIRHSAMARQGWRASWIA